MMVMQSASIPVSGGFNGDYSSSGTLIQTNNRNKLLNFEFKRDGESDASYNSDFHPINAGTYWVRIHQRLIIIAHICKIILL